ncbi:MAG TPA: general secretion pathway protein GspB, partial [Albitalea sp.]
PAPRETAAPARRPEPTLPTATAAAPPAVGASAAEERIYALNELPPDVRRELPTLNVGGSIYSDNAASRFLIINGQIFHENDKVTPNLTLEQIKLKAAVLKYKGYRYTIGF